MKQNAPNITSSLTTFRIETLEDGVFSIAMTLLVLNLKIPDSSQQSVFLSIVKIWPNLLTFFGSFLLLGVYWFGHRTALHYIKNADHVFHWFGILLLMFVSIVPFSASMIANYHHDQGAIILYGLNLIAISLSMYWQWCYATSGYRLIEKDLPAYVICFAKNRFIFAPMAYLLAICLSFVNIVIPLILYTIIPVFYIIPIFLPLWERMAKYQATKDEPKLISFELIYVIVYNSVMFVTVLFNIITIYMGYRNLRLLNDNFQLRCLMNYF